MADGKVKIDVELTKKQFEKDVQSLTENTEKSFSTMTSSIKKMLGGLAIGAAVKNLASIGLSFNSQMETYTTNFKVMLGSQEDAIKRVNYLKDLAAKTPYELTDLADATQTLLAFQVPANETNKILNQLGDIAMGNKERLSSLALVFGQVSSAGRLTGQDLLQFNYGLVA